MFSISIFTFIAIIMTQYILGNPLYSLFIIIFFLILLILKESSLMLLTLTLISITVFSTQLIDTLANLKESDINSLHYYQNTIQNVFTPNSGQEVLPQPVLQMLEIIETNQIEDYQLSDLLEKDPSIFQRISESAWPVRMSSTSKYFFITPNEIENYTACTMIGQSGETVLVVCN